MKEPKQSPEFGRIDVRNVPTLLIKDLIKIAKREGFSTLTAFMKVKCKQIRDSYPKHYFEDE
jgi:hypothetical protein